MTNKPIPTQATEKPITKVEGCASSNIRETNIVDFGKQSCRTIGNEVHTINPQKP